MYNGNAVKFGIAYFQKTGYGLCWFIFWDHTKHFEGLSRTVFYYNPQNADLFPDRLWKHIYFEGAPPPEISIRQGNERSPGHEDEVVKDTIDFVLYKDDSFKDLTLVYQEEQIRSS
jgi:hypothetical protein